MNSLQKIYTDASVASMDQIGLESRALVKSASALNQIKEHWEEKRKDLSDALDKNRLLWTVLATAMRDGSSPQPESIRNNIINLALFIFQRTISVLADPKPESLDILISINMNIAKGLSAKDENLEKK